MDDINDTIEFIFDVKPDFLAIHIFEILPKTLTYRELIEKGLLKKDYYKEYFTHPVGPIPSIQLLETIEKKKLAAIRARTIRRYYFRIGYCLQILKKIKQFIIATARGIFGIAVEVIYALAIMSVTFFICILLTSF